MSLSTDESEQDRPTFYATPVEFLYCTPSNSDHSEGEPVTTIAIARKNDIEWLLMNLSDARRLALKLLVSLATYHDEFAMRLLDEHFASDDDGEFRWPQSRGS